MGPATDSFISQSNLAVCAQGGGHGGSGGTRYQTSSYTGQGVHLCACVVCKKPAPCGLKSCTRDPMPVRRPAEVDRGARFKREERLIRFGGIYMGSSGSQLSHVGVSSPMYTSENHFLDCWNVWIFFFPFALQRLKCICRRVRCLTNV